jgi:phosphoesterase RecJ-like protein
MSYTALLENLPKHKCNYVIATHISPDSDAIGSSVALYLALKSAGKNVNLYLEKPLTERFIPLVPKNVKIIHEVPTFEFIFVGIDCATKKRLGDDFEELLYSSRASFNIDHHKSNENWAKYNYIDDVSPASACIIYQIICDLELDISPEIASLLYAGILDDTGFFRFANTTPECLIIAGTLVELGAKPADISNIIHFEVPKRVVNLRAKALNTLTFYDEDRIALLYVTQAMLDEAGCSSEDSEGLVDFARSVQGVQLGFFIREMDGKWKVSCRAKTEKYDVNELAGKFGGGGHKMASGFTFEGTLDDCISATIKEAGLLLN